LNISFVFVYNKPLDPTTVYNGGGSTSLYDYSVGYVPATVTLSSDGRTITMVPTTNLVPGHYYSANTEAYDMNGNGPGSGSYQFYAWSTSDTTLPQVSYTTPNASQTGVATNTVVEADFNEPVSGTSLGQITLTANGSPVAITASLVSGTSVRLTPGELLQPNTTYTVNTTGVSDLGGNVMASPFTFSFTTGLNVGSGGTQLNSATVQVSGVGTQLIAYNNVSAVSTGTTIQLAFSAPIEVLSILNQGAYLVQTNTNTAVPLNVSISADGMEVTLMPASALASGTEYTLYFDYGYGAVYDESLYGVTNYGYYYLTTQ
jgi:hypothetical protein